MNFLDDLNESQRKAVEYCDGPSLVIAGAGSGKTRVLTYKIAYLLSQGMKPWNILALTFTNKAANEMKQRIGALVGNDMARSLNMGTFHSVFSRILRVEAASLGYASNYTIYDEKDSQDLLKTIIKEKGLDDKTYKPAALCSYISLNKNKLEEPFSNSTILNDIYKRYCDRCKKANAMDFDDILINIYTLFKDHEDIRLKYSNKFKYILIDEYQDTSRIQQEVILQLSKEHLHVCAVGDDAQSIYSFRGADINNILNFDKVFAGTHLFKLEQNYRSTQSIVQASNKVISRNEHQIPKELFSCNEKGVQPIVRSAYNDLEEAKIVCNEIKRLQQTGRYGYNDFAILYRSNSLSRIFEEELYRDGIPYRKYGGLSFFQKKEIKDLIAYFRLIVNPDDEEAFKRIINYPKRGVGDVSIDKIKSLSSANNVSMWQVVSNPNLYKLSLSKSTFNKIQEFVLLIQSFIEKENTTDAFILCEDIIEKSGMSEYIYSDKVLDSVREGIDGLRCSIKEFVENQTDEDDASLSAYLRYASLQTDIETADEVENVSLMTVHNAKGLEFPVVFVVGLEIKIFPTARALAERGKSLEEERRLFYVAITRAKELCFLTYAKKRRIYGIYEDEEKSFFLDEITSNTSVSRNIADDEYLYVGRLERWQNSRPVASQFRADPKPRVAVHREEPPVHDTFSPSFQRLRAVASMQSRRIVAGDDGGKATVGSLKENCVIEHERFGMGKVIRLEGSGENMKATVQFENAGVKQLLVKFARFTVVREG